MFNKICVLGYSYEDGVSIIVNALLNPRMNNAKRIEIKSKSPNDIINLFYHLDDNNDVIAYQKGTKTFDFINLLTKVDDSINDFDFFVIPTNRMAKIQRETLIIIENLLTIGVEPKKIKVIFTEVEQNKTLNSQFEVIFNNTLSNDLQLNKLENQFTLNETPIFEILSEEYSDTNFFNGEYDYNRIFNDKSDFKELILKANSEPEIKQLSTKKLIKRMAEAYEIEFNKTFNRLIQSFYYS